MRTWQGDKELILQKSLRQLGIKITIKKNQYWHPAIKTIKIPINCNKCKPDFAHLLYPLLVE